MKNLSKQKTYSWFSVSSVSCQTLSKTAVAKNKNKTKLSLSTDETRTHTAIYIRIASVLSRKLSKGVIKDAFRMCKGVSF